MNASANTKTPKLNGLPPGARSAALEPQTVMLARSAMVDWVVNVVGQEKSVLLTIEIEHLSTQSELVAMLERLCGLFDGLASPGSINRHRAQIAQLLGAGLRST
jgi:hypothetical protein